jgi:hypothetical protein
MCDQLAPSDDEEDYDPENSTGTYGFDLPVLGLTGWSRAQGWSDLAELWVERIQKRRANHQY